MNICQVVIFIQKVLRKHLTCLVAGKNSKYSSSGSPHACIHQVRYLGYTVCGKIYTQGHALNSTISRKSYTSKKIEPKVSIAILRNPLGKYLEVMQWLIVVSYMQYSPTFYFAVRTLHNNIMWSRTYSNFNCCFLTMPWLHIMIYWKHSTWLIYSDY